MLPTHLLKDLNPSPLRINFFLFCVSKAKTTTHPPAFALVVIHAGAMPNRTFEVSVQENKANTVIYDLEVWFLLEHQTEL